MLMVHLDYLRGRVLLHTNPECAQAQAVDRSGECFVRMDIVSLSEALGSLWEYRDPFARAAQLQHLWLEIDFLDEPFETAVLQYILKLIQKEYAGFPDFYLDEHC